MPIGEFATASRLSQKALRLYGERGLLPPAWVDAESGYRYYRVDQLRTATLIGLLRGAQMPLAEIRSFLRSPSVAALAEYERSAAAEFAERRRVLRYVQRLLEEEPMFDVETKHVPGQPYVSRSAHVYVKDLEPFIQGTLRELSSQHGQDGCPFTLYHGPVNDDETGPVEVCLPTGSGDKQLPAGEVAFTTATGKQCDFPEILGAYDAVARWAKERGREFNGSCREVYLPDSENGQVRMEIAFPLR